MRTRWRPISWATRWASMSMSKRTSRWSETKPMGHETTSVTPAARLSRRTSRMSGPSHGSAVRPADCQATSSARARPGAPRPGALAQLLGVLVAAARGSSRGASAPRRCTSVCRGARRGSCARASLTRWAMSSRNPGASYHAPTRRTSTSSPRAPGARPCTARSTSTRSAGPGPARSTLVKPSSGTPRPVLEERRLVLRAEAHVVSRPGELARGRCASRPPGRRCAAARARCHRSRRSGARGRRAVRASGARPWRMRV